MPPDTVDDFGIPKFFESNKIHISGLIVANYSDEFSHWNAVKSLGQFLSEAGLLIIPYSIFDTSKVVNHFNLLFFFCKKKTFH